MLLSAYMVTNADDAGPGSLRQAIQDADANGGPDTINFAIPGAGVHIIRPHTPLPAITDQVTVDATTQPGYQGKPLIEINGDKAPAGTNGITLANPPGTLVAQNSILEGVIVSAFPGDGVVLAGNWDHVLDCYIGTDSSGQSPLPNSGNGILIEAYYDTIGRNIIAFNRGAGVSIVGNIYGDQVSADSIFSNGGIGIDLGGDGPTPNHPGGVADGPNFLQDYPTIVSAIAGSTGTGLLARLDAQPDFSYAIEFFASPVGGIPGQAKTYLGTAVGLYLLYPHPLPAGTYITATATRLSGGPEPGNTSELSPAVPVITDTSPPTVRASYADAGAWRGEFYQTITLTYNKDMTWTADPGALTLENLTTGRTYPSRGQFTDYTVSGNTVTINMDEKLADGNYVATVSYTQLDFAGNPLDGSGNGVGGTDYTFNFFVLAGDVNHDRSVDFKDLVILARHFNQPGLAADGDLDADGQVDFKDLVLLARNYGHTLPPPTTTVVNGLLANVARARVRASRR